MQFSYEIRNSQLIYDDPKKRQDFLAKKPEGFRGFEQHRGVYRAKSSPQLGWYWGLLVPEISKALIALGWTVSKGRGKTEVIQKWDRDGDDKKYNDTHDWLKENAAQIGGQGEYVTLSDQDMDECRRFLDNVMWICEHWLKMNVEKLEAKRPGSKEEKPGG